MKTLTTQQKQKLKGQAHRLKPIVFIGNNGFTENVKKEIDRALTDHELIKIRIQAMDRDERKSLFEEICQQANAFAIQLVGGVGIIYRQNEMK